MTKFGWIKTKKQQKGILSTLKKIRKTIETPDKWIKGELEDTKYDSDDNEVGYGYCAVGAVNEVDGPFEDDTLRTLVLSLTGKFALKDWKSYLSVVTEDDGLYDLGDFLEEAEERQGAIFDFNDDSSTKHSQVLALIDRASRNVEKAL